jgi:hypothetical protein
MQQLSDDQKEPYRQLMIKEHKIIGKEELEGRIRSSLKNVLDAENTSVSRQWYP